jgi:hypothetical protein
VCVCVGLSLSLSLCLLGGATSGSFFVSMLASSGFFCIFTFIFFFSRWSDFRISL